MCSNCAVGDNAYTLQSRGFRGVLSGDYEDWSHGCGRGEFSEEAGRVYAKKWLKSKRIKLDYLVTAEKVLSALEAGDIDIGIFAIENSNGGIVIEAVHAMAKHRFAIKKIFEIEVHHCLLVKKGGDRRTGGADRVWHY